MTPRDKAYRFMESYKRTSAKIRLLEIEAERNKSDIFRITQLLSGDDFVSAGESDNSREKMIFGYLIIRDQISEEVEKAAKLRIGIEEAIDMIEETNESQALVLRSRYLSFLSVRLAAKELGWTERRIKQITSDAMDSVAMALAIQEEKRKEPNEEDTMRPLR